jgi:transposase
MDDAGRILKEVRVASEPRALLKVLGNPGLEAGPLSALSPKRSYQCCVETRHMQAV